MVIIKYYVTHLHHKWCVHSVLPLAPRAKQPALHIHACNRGYSKRKRLICRYNNMHTQQTGLWSSPGFSWQPEEANGVDLTCCFICSLSCKVCKADGGKHCVVWTCQKLLSCYGTLREPTMPTPRWLQCKAMRLKFPGIFRTSYRLDLSKDLKYLNDPSKILKYFGWIFLHFHHLHSPKERKI